ncbi:hypothetical protein EMGBS15_13250 [Filimonas sp.]|jgi:hypothetical protein|nr:hypothetical protein EMGBS15_13250 [Filimonas sp.]
MKSLFLSYCLISLYTIFREPILYTQVNTQLYKAVYLRLFVVEVPDLFRLHPFFISWYLTTNHPDLSLTTLKTYLAELYYSAERCHRHPC